MLNTTTAGSALITKVIAGTNVNITNTGVDAGTGDVTVNVGPTLPSVAGGNVLTIGSATVGTATAAPNAINFDTTYSSVAGQHPKINLYGNLFGIGVSASQLDIISSANCPTAFWAGSVKVASLSAAGVFTLAGLTGMTTPLSVAQGGTGGTAFALSALSDVSVTENFSENNTALVYSVNKWTQVPFQLQNLTDVNVVESEVTNNTTLVFNSTANQWEQQPYGPLAFVTVGDFGINNGDMLTYSAQNADFVNVSYIYNTLMLGGPLDLGLATTLNVADSQYYDLGVLTANWPTGDLGVLTQPTIAGVPFNGVDSIQIPLQNLTGSGNMSWPIQWLRNVYSYITTVNWPQGVFVFDTTYNRLHLQDGATNGGFPTGLELFTPVADAAYQALMTDRVIAYTSLTASRIVTLPAAAGFPPGAPLTVVDLCQGVTTAKTISIARAGSDTINGGTTSVVMWAAGDSLTLRSDGVSKWEYRADRQQHLVTLTSTGTYTPTVGVQFADVYLVAPGGGGGGGALQAASAAVSGGAGGGGGGSNFGTFSIAEIGASQTVTLGAAGTAGAAAATSTTAGGAGGAGGNASFGSLMYAYGGGGGQGGQLAAASTGGGGGGTLAAGVAGASGGVSIGGGGNGGVGVAGTFGPQTGGGGGGNGCAATGAVSTPNSNFSGPGGGGCGGGITSGNAVSNGGSAGVTAVAGTGATGGAGVGAAGTAPSTASRMWNMFFGSGGAGGASSVTAAYAGGAGGLPGGGGGGGGSAQNSGTAGAGAVGGLGYAIIIERF